MKIPRTLIALALLLSVRFAAQQQFQPASVEGVITRQGTNEPLANAIVELRRGSEATALMMTTGESGKFRLDGVPPGEYRLTAVRQGFIPAQYGQRQVGGPGQTLVLRENQRATGIRIELTAGGVISGRVTDRGEPSGNTIVNVVRIAYELGHPIQQTVLAGRTDDRGEYRIYWLPPGKYYVWAGPLDYEVDANLSGRSSLGTYNPYYFMTTAGRYVLSTRTLHPSTRSTERHMLTYYGNTRDVRKARAIDLTAGSEVSGVDIQADMLPALHVRGSVSGIPNGTPGQAIRATVTLLPEDASSFVTLPILQTDANGTFEMQHVSPGGYIVYATAGNLQSRVPIDVTDRDVNGVSVALSAGLNVAGSIMIEDPAGKVRTDSLSALRVSLMTDPALGGFLMRETAMASFAGPVAPGGDGTFSIPGNAGPAPLPGNYRVYISPFLTPVSGWSATRIQLPTALTSTTIPPALEGAYVKSIRLGDRDVLNDGVRLDQNPREPLTIVIGTDAAIVEGAVVDSQKKPVGSAIVALAPENGLKFHINHRYTTTNAAGRFQLKNMAPGDYRVFAWEYAEAGSWQDPDFLRSQESRGQLVHLPAGNTTTLSLTSIP